MTFWDSLGKVSLKAAEICAVYAVIASAKLAVDNGSASKNQVELINAYQSVLTEQKTRLELEAMQREAKELADKQAKFQARWQHLLPESG